MSATVTNLANADQAVTETVAWSTTSNAYSSTDADASATNAPGANNQSNTRSWGFPAIAAATIPDGSTLNSVILRYRIKCSASTTGVLGIQGDIAGSTIGSETTTAGSAVTAFTTQTISLTGLVTLTDLRTANRVRARIRANRSNSAVTWSLDYVQLEVTYTPYYGFIGNVPARMGQLVPHLLTR